MLVYEQVADPDFLVALAVGCERLGFESVWTTEHVVFPEGGPSAPSPYVSDERNPRGGRTPRLDPLEALSFLAGHTTRVRLATSVVVLPLRHPVMLAKQTATIDCLSRGRLTLGVGVGWLEEEFAALGVPFDQRGRIADEWIDVLRAMWHEDSISFDGTYVSFERVLQYPKPVRGDVPVVVCGMSRAAACRAGTRGDGFFPLFKEAKGLPDLVAHARDAAERGGRDARELEITTGLPKDPGDVEMLPALGVDRIVVPSLGMKLGVQAVLDGLQRVVDDVTSQLGPIEPAPPPPEGAAGDG
jgi:probable F420-dependent oxidoreductase